MAPPLLSQIFSQRPSVHILVRLSNEWHQGETPNMKLYRMKERTLGIVHPEPGRVDVDYLGEVLSCFERQLFVALLRVIPFTATHHLLHHLRCCRRTKFNEKHVDKYIK